MHFSSISKVTSVLLNEILFTEPSCGIELDVGMSLYTGIINVIFSFKQFLYNLYVEYDCDVGSIIFVIYWCANISFELTVWVCPTFKILVPTTSHLLKYAVFWPASM